MTEKDFIAEKDLFYPTSGKTAWKAPSNIALVKYWGKHPNQIPANPSISFTLDESATKTTVAYKKREQTGNGFSFDFLFEGKPKADFIPKIDIFFERIAPYLPFLKQFHFTIGTTNSFPHSSGIASSASGMAALSLCLLQIEKQAYPEMSTEYFEQKASFLARLGSGSACRSILGNLVQWGRTIAIPNSSDLYGISYPFEIHEDFKHFQDTILLVHKGKKAVSSTVGHGLMKGHPFADPRFQQAHENLERLQPIFASGDLESFINVVESEALTLHAMMMTSQPYFILMAANTLEIIQRIWQFRKASGIPICFTLDAGANVHVLYPKKQKERCMHFIQDELVVYCENGQYICDQMGRGAQVMEPDR
ncbi:MAG: diphosphomevalonate decarboxylase [Bacteroidota bacterium]